MAWTLTAIVGAGKPEARIGEAVSCTGPPMAWTLTAIVGAGQPEKHTVKSVLRTGKSMPHTGAACTPCLTSGGRAPLGRAARGA
jgi:hypothetical protein